MDDTQPSMIVIMPTCIDQHLRRWLHEQGFALLPIAREDNVHLVVPGALLDPHFLIPATTERIDDHD